MGTLTSQRRLLTQRVSQIRDATAEMLFPASCFACGQSLGDSEREPPGACAACWAELPLLEGPTCQRCGAPTAAVLGTDEPGCGHCRHLSIRFDEAIAAGIYDGLLRHLVLRAKHPAEESVAIALGNLMSRRANDRLRVLKPDVVATVPMHWRRRLLRQTNSPELMGDVVAQSLGVPFAPRLLRRTRATLPQPSVATSDRLPNVRNAFRLRRGYRLAGATVVLIDDILTTGATCSEAARALRRAGAERVVAVVAARSL